MTSRLLQLYETINAWWTLHNYAPTVRELAAACGLASGSTVLLYLRRLRALGLVTWAEGRARTIRVTNGRT